MSHTPRVAFVGGFLRSTTSADGGGGENRPQLENVIEMGISQQQQQQQPQLRGVGAGVHRAGLVAPPAESKAAIASAAAAQKRIERADEEERSALMGLCGADLHSVSQNPSLSHQHPLLREDPPHICFNAFPLAVMGAAWLCQLPMLLFPLQPLLSLPLAYAFSLILGAIFLSYRYPSWTMDIYFVREKQTLRRFS